MHENTHMKTIDTKAMQTVMLDMLDDFTNYCDAHGYVYLLDYGTLLGAVRHQGFIPWDDDMDIMMMRDDFERAICGYQSDRYEAYCHCNTEDYSGAWAKLVDTWTTSVSEKHGDGAPVSIDIYPVDRLPESPRVRWVESRIQQVLLYIIWACVTPFGHMSTAFVGAPKTFATYRRYLWRSFVKNAMILVFRHTRASFWGRISERLAKRHHDSGNPEMAFVVSPNPYEPVITEAFFEKRKKCPFEDRAYWIPEDYDSYLTQIYGDYMTPVPPEARIGKHQITYLWRDDIPTMQR